MKLLLIEDNPTMQATLQRSFERRGMQVLTCGDGARALALWQACLPDAVLPDLSLPGRDAAQVSSVDWCGLRMDRDSGAVYAKGLPLDLPPRELALLRALLQRPGHAIAKECLLDTVFPGDSTAQPEAIELVAYRLRKKLADTGVQLVTLPGLGYLLKAAPA